MSRPRLSSSRGSGRIVLQGQPNRNALPLLSSLPHSSEIQACGAFLRSCSLFPVAWVWEIFLLLRPLPRAATARLRTGTTGQVLPVRSHRYYLSRVSDILVGILSGNSSQAAALSQAEHDTLRGATGQRAYGRIEIATEDCQQTCKIIGKH